LKEDVDATTAPERLTSAVASAFSLTTAFLAAVGIYGLFAYSSARRTREIGVRMAIGARPSDIAGMFAFQGALTGALGISMATAAALLFAPIAKSLLYEVSPLDPASYVFAGLFMAVAAALATAIPATRAALTRPAEALRQEGS